MTKTHPIDTVKSDPSKAVRVNYDNGSTEVIWHRSGLLFGFMNGVGPAPLDESDARAVCDKYEFDIIEPEGLKDND